MSENTLLIQQCIDQLNAGDTSVRGELLNIANRRLLHLTAKMKRGFRAVGRWEQTEDVFQNASLRLYQALQETRLQDVRHFFRLAAMQIRRELIDLSRRYQGPQGIGANHASLQPRATADGSRQIGLAEQVPASESLDAIHLQQWGEFHRCASELPDKEREVFELIWYHELKQDEVAEMLEISTRHVKRLWRSARLILHENLKDDSQLD